MMSRDELEARLKQLRLWRLLPLEVESKGSDIVD